MNKKNFIVFFDAGHTLIHTKKSVAKIYSEFGSKFGTYIKPSIIHKSLKIAWHDMINEKLETNSLRYGINNESARRWWGEFIKRVFLYVDYKGDIDSLCDELYNYFSLAELWTLYEDTLSTINSLRKKGYKTGIISNWDIRLENIIKELNIEKLFDYIFISCNVGYEKPDRRIFDFALKTSGFKPSEAFHIGDSLKEDIIGAKNCGITPLLICRKKEFSHHEINAADNNGTINISNLKECIPIIEKLTGNI